MPEQKQEEEQRRADEEVRRNLPPGVKLVRTLRQTGESGRIAWSADGELLASPESVDKIRLWNATRGWVTATLAPFAGCSDMPCVAFGRAGWMLASARYDNTVHLWVAGNQRAESTIERWQEDNKLHMLFGHSGDVYDVSFDPAGCILASGSADNTIKLWKVGWFEESWEGDPYGQYQSLSKRWRGGSGELLCTLEGHKRSVYTVAFDPTGKTLASGSQDGTVKLWEPRSGYHLTCGLLRTLEAHDAVYTVAFDHAGRTLASGGRDSTVKLWDVRSGRLLQRLPHRFQWHNDYYRITSVAFGLEGRILASKGGGRICIWDTATGRCLAEISEIVSPRWPPGVAFHPRLPRLAAVGSTDQSDPYDNCIHIYELDLVALQKS